MGILAVIPARGGSKGVPRKNLRSLQGKPLLAWTIEAAKACGLVDRVVVSTEDPEIEKAAKDFGAEVPFLRPADLATDTALTLPVVQHAVREIEKDGFHADLVLLLQPTTPLRTTTDIEAALRLQRETDCDCVVSVVDVGGNHPNRMKKLLPDGKLVNFVDQGFEDMRPRQLLPPVYIREGSIYLAKRAIVMDQGSMVGGDVRGIVIPPERAVNIDTMDDFERAEKKISLKKAGA